MDLRDNDQNVITVNKSIKAVNNCNYVIFEAHVQCKHFIPQFVYDIEFDNHMDGYVG